MNLSAPFVRRPIGTVLLTIGIALTGVAGFFALPVAPLPDVDFPVISVSASLAGASPETMATSVATPLERRLGIIAGVNELTSRSSAGSTRVTMQFDLNRDIDSAAREVQAAINASRADLPATLRSNPSYRKANPSDAPMVVLALSSETRTPQQIFEAVSNEVEQRLAQVAGVGDVEIGGGSLPAIRVDLIPFQLNRYGISLEDVRAAIEATNANRPKGALEGDGKHYQIYTATSGRNLEDYKRLVVAWRNDAPIRLGDVAEISDGPEDLRTLGLFNGSPAVVVLLRKKPGANVIETVNAIRALVPELQAELPNDVKLQIATDSTNSIRSSLHEIEITLLISVLLVVLVVSAFLRNVRATIVPAIATVVSLLGTFGVMYALGFSLNNLSLMALTIATGFVVDDAIVVLENTSRHLEAGMGRVQAALLGAREVGFTVLAISLSLIAVFIPLLFLGGQAGRLFREFAVTLSVSVMISLVISLTTTPMLCALLLRGGETPAQPGRIARFFEAGFTRLLKTYEHSLDWALAARPLVLLSLLAIIVLNVYLFIAVPKGFFPQQDSGRIMGGLQADQSISFQAMSTKLKAIVDTIRKDPAVDTVIAFTGGSRAGGGFLLVQLKPKSQRTVGGQEVIARLRAPLGLISGVNTFLSPIQDLRMGARQSNANYQFTLKGDDIAELKSWTTRLADAMKLQPQLEDVSTDQEDRGVEEFVSIDHDAAARYGISAKDIDNALYNAFGQRTASTIYEELNQYSVILEVAPRYAQSADALNDVYVPAKVSTGDTTTKADAADPGLRDASSGTVLSTAVTPMVPLSAIAHFSERATPSSISHQDAAVATTISFNAADGVALSDAEDAVRQAEARIAMPTSISGSFEGTARAAQDSQGQQPLLIGLAIVVVYLVLGVLYESYVHPLTVLSTLPSAGVGAVLALLIFHMDFSLIALIAVFLLIGIVKKNAILIIDFALETQRARGVSAIEAVREACLLRFRPILMTTMAAALGALPLAIGFGEGSELRQPLGVAIIGGLIASQILTLLTTPVVYVYLDRLRRRRSDEHSLSRAAGIESQGIAS
ncbi:efflux RND transporter permease subunit [Solimonas terrae]|uniref:MMPL family transporter n=1 Tax=Solimonas terrae TaxID=1396819 RepID=A0A6M2BWY7_9GAMM|nr:efflux RND transporter permease subunit [Solimonas terrae]NGY06701.1 MMPL family transporter [Solimonas terrae]